ncbi:hypothetical protein Pmani_010766 [Petrolisthes manimaculis]|uniref:Uncharacterized protein n=1 Tax=Petrolisthes manimaculis TaxID=1843537 RepID=A0AAE1UGZ3_9EUCA|nr:hypothetical protein Pmani_010766 [Petrolisthes manimaculis]
MRSETMCESVVIRARVVDARSEEEMRCEVEEREEEEEEEEKEKEKEEEEEKEKEETIGCCHAVYNHQQKVPQSRVPS